MIIGVSHITLASTDMAADGRILEGLGYRHGFTETDIPNVPGKRQFMSGTADRQDLAYYQTERGTSIELVRYGKSLPHGTTAFHVLFHRKFPDAAPTWNAPPAWASVWKAATNHAGARAGDLPAFDTPFWFSDNGSAQEGVSAILRPVRDLNRAVSFWSEALGCVTESRGAGHDQRKWVRAAFRRPVRNWSLDMIFIEDPDTEELPMLDGRGYTCLALLTSNLKQDREKLLNGGAPRSTGIFSLTINGKRLDIELFRSPSGELIEMFQIVTGQQETV